MAKSGAVIGPLLCPLPTRNLTSPLQMMRNTANPGGLTSLDSIATAAVKLLSSTPSAAVSNRNVADPRSITKASKGKLNEKEERLRERRSQIAAASRKSRAKRKREHSVLKEENELLLLEVSALRKRLRTYVPSASTSASGSLSAEVAGAGGASDRVKQEEALEGGGASQDSCDTSASTVTIAPLKKKLVSRYSSDALKVEEAKLTREAKSEAQKEIFERVKAVISPDLRARLTAEPEMDTAAENHQKRGYSTLEETLSDAREALEPAMEETPVLREILGFFHKQLEEYFAFLKSDVVGHFGSNFSKEKREALLDLRLRFLSP